MDFVQVMSGQNQGSLLRLRGLRISFLIPESFNDVKEEVKEGKVKIRKALKMAILASQSS